MSSNNNDSIRWGFPFPVLGDDHVDAIPTSTLSSNSTPSMLTTTNAPKLQGKVHKAAINGNLSVASILSNAFLLPGFPRSSYAINQAGKLGMTFSQIDVISKRLALMISSLVVLPGADYQVGANNDGDSVILFILDDEDQVDEKLIVLIFAILNLGAAYMVVTKDELSSDWSELSSLIEPILVVTTGDPIDLSTAMKNDLNIVSREHFDDYLDEDTLDLTSPGDSETGSTTEMNPLQTSTMIIKKIRSNLILKPNILLKPYTMSCKLLWDLAVELRVANERELQVLTFRSEVGIGQRTVFIFPCICTSPHPGAVQRWCRLSHKALRNRISWERLEFPIKTSEKLCLTFPLQDPRSLVQIFNCFIHGKSLIVGEPGEFSNGAFLLRQLGSDVFKNVRRLELTPERFKDLLDVAINAKQEFHLSRIKVWLVSTSSGDPFTYALAKQFFQKVKANDVMLVVTYGTGECLWSATWNIFSSMKEVNKCNQLEKDGDGKLFLGQPTINTTIFLVDERRPGGSCSLGQKGTVCVLGSMIASGGYCGSAILGRNISVFQTGDTGRFVQDKTGEIQLIVDPRPAVPTDATRRKIIIHGKLVDLEEISKQVKKNSAVVREACAFVCQRARDFPEIVVAVVLKDPGKFDSVKEMITTTLNVFDGDFSSTLRCFPVSGTFMPRISLTSEDNEKPIVSGRPVDLKNLRAAYFKYLGKCHPRDWLSLIPARGPETPKISGDETIEKTIQIICKAIAFSLGRTLVDIIDNFERSFWDLGGTPMRALIAIKSCLCQGKALAIEDFMMADRISELGFRLLFAEKTEMKWIHEVELIRHIFIYSRITRSDHDDMHGILISNLSKMFPKSEQKVCEKYATALIEAFDNSLSAVALSSDNREMLGIALNYRGNLKSHFIPTKLEEGLELYNSVIQSCRHLTGGIESKNIAKSYMLSFKTASLVHPSQVLLLLRDLIRESMGYAESVGCRGFLVCSQDPLVQEVCCSLLGFEVLTEIQLNMYRNKKFQKPFAHLDDYQLIGAYFSKLGGPILLQE